ncbi:hypothetical protein IMSAG049_00936 [Clostridiales bacterium]|nr:hypothetical protein IMSAG049_00936 [Clostridiales bacterium]
MKDMINIFSLILSLLFILAGIAIIPMTVAVQNLIFAIMVLIIVGIFGIIRFIAYKKAAR